MKKKLLLDLADLMETVAEDRYDQDSWMDGVTADVITYSRAVDPEYSRIKLKEGFCNTGACVLGHATTVPSIQKAGLFIAVDSDKLRQEKEDLKNGVTPWEIRAVVGKITRGSFVSGFRAACEVFDIPYNHAELMFDNMNDAVRLFYTGDINREPTPKLVADAIRAYVETDGKYAEEVIAKLQAIYGTEEDDE